MLVIADSSPLIVLINIGFVDILPKLFGQVMTPPQVAAELSLPRRPDAVREFATKPLAWLGVHAPSINETIPHLHEGELAAINLAREIGPDCLLLIDEMNGRKAAESFKIAKTGTIGVPEMAAKGKLLNLRTAFDRLKKTDFWVAPRLPDERLAAYEKWEAGSRPRRS